MKYVEKNTCIERFFHKRGKKVSAFRAFTRGYRFLIRGID